MKHEFCRQIFEKIYINVSENMAGEIRVVPCGMEGERADGQTDRQTEGNDETDGGFR